uniref:Uncharacterized protein n=1 Tax=Vespula pensylvanica TaxID=30213 RepID=A0A834JMC8_VESPE|nr:hypothetical protein H0235_018211 [Vespula pensylvanica]
MDCSRAWGKGPGGVSGGVAERRVSDLPALPVAMMVVVGGGVGGGGCLAPVNSASFINTDQPSTESYFKTVVKAIREENGFSLSQSVVSLTAL